MTSLATAFVTIKPDTSGFGSDLSRQVNAQTAKAGTAAGDNMSRSFKSRLGGMAKVAAGALGVAATVGVAAYAKGAVSLEAEFGRTMNVLKATTRAPQKDMRDLTDLAMKMGRDTVFSANDASKAMLELARGGMSAATIQAGALKGTMTLAAAGQLEMGDAASYVVKAMGQFGLKGKDASSIAAALAGAANASSASVHDLGFSLSSAGLAANSVGFSLQETTGILAAFSNKGLEGQDAGTSLKTMLDRLVPSTDKASGALEELGVITDQGRNRFLKANGEYKSAARIAEILKTSTEDLTASERKRLITQAFGSDAQRAATIFARDGAKGMREMTKATSDQGAANRAAAANMKGTAGALEAMRGSLETVQLAFGKAIKPLVIFGATIVTEVANKALPYVDKFGVLLRKTLSGIDVKDGVSGFFRGISNAVRGIDLHSVSLGFAGIGDSLRSIDWAAFRDAFGQGAADTVNVFGVAIGFAADHIDTLAKYMPLLVGAFIAYKAAQGAANVLAIASIPLDAARIASNFALAASQRALALQLAILNGQTRVGFLTRIKDAAVTAAQTTATLAQAAATRIAAAASRVWAAGQWLLNAALSANPIGLVVAALAALVAGLVIAYKHSETFRNIVNDAWAKIKAAISAAWEKVIQPVFKALSAYLTNVLFPVYRALWDRVVKPVMQKVGAGIAAAWNGVIKPVFNALKQGVEAVRDAFSTAVNKIGDIWNGLKRAAAVPVNFIIGTVFNKGIVPLVNAIPGVGDIKTLPLVNWGSGGGDGGSGASPGGGHQAPGSFAQGGVLPGYTPGRDVHHFYSPSAGQLHLSGGEAIMRPEWAKAVGGEKGVKRLNEMARKGIYHFAGGGIFRPTASGSYGAVHDQWTGFPAVDVRVGTGTPVHAVAPGQVTVSQDLATSYGHWIKLAHAGFQSLYAHLERRLVGVGARVAGGQLIGYSDSTGNSTGPHLHFGVSGRSPLSFMSASTNYGSAGSADTGGGGVGGFLGGLWDKAKNLVSGLGDKLGGWVSHLGDMGGWGPMLGGTVKSIVGDVIDWAKDKISSAISEGSGASSTPGAAGPKNYAMSILGNYGWGSDQFTPLDQLWTRESGWNYKATNPSSGAYGIPQALPPGKMASAGADWRTNPATQIRWGLGYIKGRYGNPAGAWAHSESTGWYDKGGLANGPGMMPKATLRPERVLSPQQTEAFERLVDKLDRGALNGNAPLVGQMVVRDERAAEAALMRTMAKANVMAALP